MACHRSSFARSRPFFVALVALAAACSAESPISTVDTGTSMDAGVGADTSGTDAGLRPDAPAEGDTPAAPDAGPCADPDSDGDGADAMECGGTDCDDADRNRAPGNPEICDALDRDEDCDPTTFGVRDLDADGYPDARCCNDDGTGSLACGTDCDDTRSAAHPSSVEACNALDDDCDTIADEGVSVSFWPDDDDDGRGVNDTTRMLTGCAGAAPPGFAEFDDDCDDARDYVHPGLPESCDLGPDSASHDENCDGMTDEDCMCVGAASRSCSDSGAVGACAAGVETCVAGRYSTCSIAPQTEVCNMADDDCNGMIDEGTTAICYADGDGDGYAPMGATASTECRVTGRESVGGCPDRSTNRAPTVGATDCDDMRFQTSPVGSEALCNGIDDDCNGTPDDGLTVACYTDNDDDSFALAGTMPRDVCPDPTRGVRGFCPFRSTGQGPGAGTTDCNDMSGSGAIDFPGAPEVCDGRDNDCDGTVDESTMVTCYTDADDDTFAPAGASSTVVCRVTGRDAFGGCPLSQTFRMPAASSSTDCDDMNGLRNPAAIEQCNSVDDNCNGTVDEMARVTCYFDGDDDGWAPTGAMAAMSCADPTRGTVGGCPTGSTDRAPSADVTMNDCRDADAASYPGALEVCDNLDNDCDTVIDDGLTRATCYRDLDDDTVAPAGAPVTMLCPDTSRPTHGDCPVGYTGAMPTATVYDCDDGSTTIRWANVTCWRDNDGDGYARPTNNTTAFDCRAGSTGATMSTAVSLCPLTMGTCDTGYTATNPGTGPSASSDCNDSATGGALRAWSTCYADVDGDGYPGNSVPSCYVCATTACLDTDPVDCCDSDTRAHAGVTAWFTTTRTGCGGYDYNCDGASTRQNPSITTLSCSYLSGEGCVQSGAPGWSSTAPACGVSGTYVADCRMSTPSACVRNGVSRTMACH